MLNVNKKIYQSNVCRRCLNERLGVLLDPNNCLYDYYKTVCSECGEIRNIVKKLRFSGLLKYTFRKK